MIVVNLLLTTTVESTSVRNCLYTLVSVNDSCKPPTNYDGRIYECKKLSVQIGVVNDSCKPPTNYDGRIYECKKLSVHIGVSE